MTVFDPWLKQFSHDQVKILLERMDSHPEEFVCEGKWDPFLPPETGVRGAFSNFNHFTKIEQLLVRGKYNKIIKAHMRQQTYNKILETLMFKEIKDKEVYIPHLGTPAKAASIKNTKQLVKDWFKD